jgi:hypothetical protein
MVAASLQFFADRRLPGPGNAFNQVVSDAHYEIVANEPLMAGFLDGPQPLADRRKPPCTTGSKQAHKSQIELGQPGEVDQEVFLQCGPNSGRRIQAAALGRPVDVVDSKLGTPGNTA